MTVLILEIVDSIVFFSVSYTIQHSLGEGKMSVKPRAAAEQK
jgi:hypothetical protein